MPLIILPTLFKKHVSEEDISVAGTTVMEVIKNLVDLYPSLRPYCLDSYNRLLPFINFYLNDKDIRYLSSELTPVKESDVITILLAIAGG